MAYCEPFTFELPDNDDFRKNSEDKDFLKSRDFDPPIYFDIDIELPTFELDLPEIEVDLFEIDFDFTSGISAG